MEENSTQLMPICNFKINPLVADDKAEHMIYSGGFNPEPEAKNINNIFDE